MHPKRTAARLALAAAALALGCDRAPSIERVGDGLPPRFRVRGGGEEFGVIFSTPGAPVDGSPRYDILWHLRPTRAGMTPSDAPEITYGAVPAGLRAIRFDPSSTRPLPQTEAPPALVPGRLYIASLTVSTPNFVSTSYRDARVCFEVSGASAREAPCPQRR